MNVRSILSGILSGVLLAVVVVLLLMVWVVVDGTFVVRGDMVNLVENPNFDEPTRGFAGWGVVGCGSYVIPPKEGAAKAGPLTFDGLCNPGQTATFSQTVAISGTDVVTFTYREILKGAGNRVVVWLTDGHGWQHTLRDSMVQNGSFGYTQPVTATLPGGTDVLTLWIEAHYQNGIGVKFTSVTLTGN